MFSCLVFIFFLFRYLVSSSNLFLYLFFSLFYIFFCCFLFFDWYLFFESESDLLKDFSCWIWQANIFEILLLFLIKSIDLRPIDQIMIVTFFFLFFSWVWLANATYINISTNYSYFYFCFQILNLTLLRYFFSCWVC